MQPLISPVDHESRNNRTYRICDEEEGERTPLITGRQIRESIEDNRNPTTTIVVTLLVFILTTGIIIGIYLLIQQQNILPLVERPLLLVSRINWDQSNSSALLQKLNMILVADRVVAMHTDTNTCSNTKECEHLLKDMQRDHCKKKEGESLLPYNFLVSSNGEIFEELGWYRASPLFPEYSKTSLVLAFIGNFSSVPPTTAQVEGAKRFFDESVSQQRLLPTFHVVGTNLNSKTPVYLYQTLNKLPQWDSKLSDTQYFYTSVLAI